MRLPIALSLFLLSSLGGGARAEGAEGVHPATAECALSIRLSGFRSDEGQVLVAIFRGESGFPGESEKAIKRAVTSVRGGEARVHVHDLPPGEYAVAVVHDENRNNALDTNFLGIPKEGLGISNNAKIRVGPPKYRDAKFSIDGGAVTQSIKIVYF
jgi:uncharacterized protein (DUF2141 family)